MSFIGKVENFKEDLQKLSSRLNTTVNIGQLDRLVGKNLPSGNISKYFTNLDENIVHKLYKIYDHDFKAFGYTKRIPIF